MGVLEEVVDEVLTEVERVLEEVAEGIPDEVVDKVPSEVEGVTDEVTKGVLEEVADGVPKKVANGVSKEIAVVLPERDEAEGIDEDERMPGTMEDVVFVSNGTTEDERTLETMNDIVFVSEGAMEVRKGKKRFTDVLELMVSKRLRFSSQYIVFSYTIEAKIRTFMDKTFPNLFCEVDQVRQKAFDEWFKFLNSE